MSDPAYRVAAAHVAPVFLDLYNRFDVFHLTVDRSEHRPIRFVDAGGEGSRGGPESPGGAAMARGDETPSDDGLADSGRAPQR